MNACQWRKPGKYVGAKDVTAASGARRLGVAIVAGAAFALCADHPGAQRWPEKPVRIVVPFGPGGGTDIQARLLGSMFHEYAGQTFIVDNRAGASGLIGAEVAAASPPDGHTILFTTASLTVNKTLFASRMKIDPVKDLAPVSWISSTPLVLVVHPSVPARSVSELVALARRRPGVLNAGINVPGSTNHLAAEMLSQMAGVEAVFVPYKGGGPGMVALIGGEIDFQFATGPVATGAMTAGKVRALAVTTARKASSFPELPTMNASIPGFEADNWYAMWFPAATPAEIVASMNALILKALKTEKVRGFMMKEGLDPVGSTPAGLADQVKREVAKYAEVIRKGNIKLQ
jgi:tripartite-type tricarboxylate transporter receptor subunit TctC